MTVSPVFSAANASATGASAKTGTGFAGMGATDFLKLLTVQMQQQDPTDPVDNKDMLAQMAQFSNLSNSAEMNSTLKAIAIKLGAIDAPASETDGNNTGPADGVTA